MIGVKLFHVNEYSMYSLTMDWHSWTLGPVSSSCRRYTGEEKWRHTPPVRGCSCGIHAWGPEGLIHSTHYKLLLKGTSWSKTDLRWLLKTRIFGFVRPSGKVIVHEHGFRAEVAEIVGFAKENIAVPPPPFSGLPLVSFHDDWEVLE